MNLHKFQPKLREFRGIRGRSEVPLEHRRGEGGPRFPFGVQRAGELGHGSSEESRHFYSVESFSWDVALR